MIISNEKITDKKFNYYDKSQNSLLPMYFNKIPDYEPDHVPKYK